MKTKHLLWIIPILILFGILTGAFLTNFGNNELMGDYDLYQCIYNNADDNGFSKNPYLIKKIQDECICWRNYNYTRILTVGLNCSINI